MMILAGHPAYAMLSSENKQASAAAITITSCVRQFGEGK
jgi:hypothetical protein